jgi:hypothetical protein
MSSLIAGLASFFHCLQFWYEIFTNYDFVELFNLTNYSNGSHFSLFPFSGCDFHCFRFRDVIFTVSIFGLWFSIFLFEGCDFHYFCSRVSLLLRLLWTAQLAHTVSCFHPHLTPSFAIFCHHLTTNCVHSTFTKQSSWPLGNHQRNEVLDFPNLTVRKEDYSAIGNC